jgi:hypothetical protein
MPSSKKIATVDLSADAPSISAALEAMARV